MSDHIFESFLEQNRTQGLALARESDILELEPLGGEHPRQYIAKFHCKGLVRDDTGAIVEADGEFRVGITFHDGYQRKVQIARLLTWLGPEAIFHSNIRAPFICLHIPPGTGLVSILHQCYELITWQKFRTDDALNDEACQWARNHQDRLPVDRRPLKRRVIDVIVEPAGEQE